MGAIWSNEENKYIHLDDSGVEEIREADITVRLKQLNEDGNRKWDCMYTVIECSKHNAMEVLMEEFKYYLEENGLSLDDIDEVVNVNIQGVNLK
ncbi:hypothetical protein V2H32_08970 [Streptococcus uberis]|uniref:hypothetical protein n=1 Tax=Streptococcus uberis TaxID=1349 RepID=UPI00062045A4|nr:hypothetical protein [Streptococcus uberis]KKF46265.1 hypothetical protein AF59_00660 [Streptococcus uberis C5072]MEE3699127.1 hypothetical protein [Streptococcus uberis]MTB42246.1 hypothetical protein [Streptococcus uberis]QBX31213.1 hypothetical protein Javan626_0025 [Streptococcus phage Javan626]